MRMRSVRRFCRKWSQQRIIIRNFENSSGFSIIGFTSSDLDFALVFRDVGRKWFLGLTCLPPDSWPPARPRRGFINTVFCVKIRFRLFWLIGQIKLLKKRYSFIVLSLLDSFDWFQKRLNDTKQINWQYMTEIDQHQKHNYNLHKYWEHTLHVLAKKQRVLKVKQTSFVVAVPLKASTYDTAE